MRICRTGLKYYIPFCLVVFLPSTAYLDEAAIPTSAIETPSQYTTFVLARHGETPMQVDRKRRGAKTDEGLSITGKEQAKAVACLLQKNGLKPDAVYSSHKTRALQTAQEIATATEYPGSIMCYRISKKE